MITSPIFLAVLLLVSPAFVRAEALKSAGGTKIAITEIADDGSHEVKPGVAVAPIDARSRIVLAFDSAALSGKSENESRWKSLQAVLEEIKELGAQRTAAIAALTAAKGSDDAAIKEAQRLAFTYSTKFLDFKGRVRKIIGEDVFKPIDLAATRRAREGRGLLQELADWASNELASLTPTSGAIAEKSPKVLVEIVAFLEPAGQDRKPIHVDNYDQLPEGILKPLPRTGLQISSEEQAKLNQDLEYAKQAAQSIDEIRQQKDALIRELMNFRGDLRGRLQQTLNTAEQQAQQLRDRVETVGLGVDGADQTAAILVAVPALASTAKSLDNISVSIKGLKLQLESLDRLRSYDFNNGIGPAMESFSSTQAIVSLGSLQNEFQALPGQIAAAANQAATSVKGLTAEQEAVVAKEISSLKADLTSNALGTFGQVTAMVPATTAMLNAWEKMFKAAREQAGASNTLGQNIVPVIQRDLNDLVPATVDLRRSGVKNGDYLSIKVRVRDADGSKLLEEKSYDFLIGSMGWHREYTGQLLFASATSGPTKNQFQANAGVIVTWKYGHRNPVGSAKFFDWLQPGLGVHATSLHQGSSTVEVGSGVALSLWDDLITGGYGWNLGVTANKPYFFVGIGILDLLHKMNKTALPKQ